jgi:Family of unknown function (DUF6573)
MTTSDPFWRDADLIHVYTRAQALADGALIDISPLATEAGFRYPVAVTAAVWPILEPSDDLVRLGQSATGRAWDVLHVLRAAIRHSGHTDRLHFTPLFVLDAAHPTPQPVQPWALCGPGDDEAPVLTVLCEGED